MQVVLHLGSKPITLNFKEFDGEIDVDQLTSIDHGNLYGEAVTISALLNHVGILKAEAERTHSLKKLEADTFEAALRQTLRKTATETAQKITEAGLTEMVEIDTGYKINKKNVITAEYNLGIVDSLFWSIKSKDQKLNNLIKGITPEELYQELIEGTINNILIKKHKSITER